MKHLTYDGEIFDSVIECEEYEAKLNNTVLKYYDFYDENLNKLDKVDPCNEIVYIVIRKDDIKIKDFISNLVKTNLNNNMNDFLVNLDYKILPWKYNDIHFGKAIYKYNYYTEKWEDLGLFQKLLNN